MSRLELVSQRLLTLVDASAHVTGSVTSADRAVRLRHATFSVRAGLFNEKGQLDPVTARLVAQTVFLLWVRELEIDCTVESTIPHFMRGNIQVAAHDCRISTSEARFVLKELRVTGTFDELVKRASTRVRGLWWEAGGAAKVGGAELPRVEIKLPAATLSPPIHPTSRHVPELALLASEQASPSDQARAGRGVAAKTETSASVPLFINKLVWDNVHDVANTRQWQRLVAKEPGRCADHIVEACCSRSGVAPLLMTLVENTPLLGHSCYFDEACAPPFLLASLRQQLLRSASRTAQTGDGAYRSNLLDLVRELVKQEGGKMSLVDPTSVVFWCVLPLLRPDHPGVGTSLRILSAACSPCSRALLESPVWRVLASSLLEIASAHFQDRVGVSGLEREEMEILFHWTRTLPPAFACTLSAAQLDWRVSVALLSPNDPRGLTSAITRCEEAGMGQSPYARASNFVVLCAVEDGRFREVSLAALTIASRTMSATEKTQAWVQGCASILARHPRSEAHFFITEILPRAEAMGLISLWPRGGYPSISCAVCLFVGRSLLALDRREQSENSRVVRLLERASHHFIQSVIWELGPKHHENRPGTGMGNGVAVAPVESTTTESGGGSGKISSHHLLLECVETAGCIISRVSESAFGLLQECKVRISSMPAS